MTTVKLMNQKDRQELRRILKARFQILHQQLHVRQQEVQRSIEEQLRSEHEAAIKEAQKKTESFRKKLEKIMDEARDLTANMEERGIVPGNGRGYYRDTFLSYSLETQWSPKDLNRRIQEAYNKITEQAGLHKLDLNLKQLQLEEELAIGALGSEEAQSFLGKIPNLDELLPMNGNIALALRPGDIEGDHTIVEDEI